ncbi:hypothetical protein PG993_011578 [Apiospora rasikravindrae]|uniref:Uncharacterized protein n=1 Tax=Apiospora rasikravindrae TaxID=990691 RepID=A0ABR1S1A7_9PEZI
MGSPYLWDHGSTLPLRTGGVFGNAGAGHAAGVSDDHDSSMAVCLSSRTSTMTQNRRRPLHAVDGVQPSEALCAREAPADVRRTPDIAIRPWAAKAAHRTATSFVGSPTQDLQAGCSAPGAVCDRGAIPPPDADAWPQCTRGSRYDWQNGGDLV